MKHKLLALAIASAAALTPMISSASDGTITFTGAITANTCTLTTDPNFTVTLPTVPVATLASSGATAGSTAFYIGLGTCHASLTGANVYFEAGPNVNTSTGRLNNTGTAGNVQLELRTKAGTAINANGTAGNQYTLQSNNITSNTAQLEYTVNYYATGATTAGSVGSSITYTVVYN